MTLTRIDNQTALNLDAIASVRFSRHDDEFNASVNFLSTGPGGRFISETFSGDAAQNLFQMTKGGNIEKSTEHHVGDEKTNPFLRTKGWYSYLNPLGNHYFVAFINAKGSCSMRVFDADTGKFITKEYQSGKYQYKFTEIIKSATATELDIDVQPNLERDCKVRLPESVLSELQKQVKC